jgi:hypothetical protein
MGMIAERAENFSEAEERLWCGCAGGEIERQGRCAGGQGNLARKEVALRKFVEGVNMNESKRAVTAGIAALVSGALIGETLQADYDRQKAAIEGPSAPTDHTHREKGEEGAVIRVSSAAVGPNVTAHSVSVSAGLSFESLRRVESPFVLPDSFDYAILKPVRSKKQ